jgi:hypothetical protein
MGPVVSTTGFEIEEIENNRNIMLNGHLHNGQAISNKVINLGNLTGKDFGEDAFKHSHNVAILDTNTFNITYIENPYAFNFYKLEINNEFDLKLLDTLKPNAVVSIKCDSTVLDKTKQKVQAADGAIIESRIIVVKKYETSNEGSLDVDLSVDHIARFIECCKANIEDTVLLDEEINEVCK